MCVALSPARWSLYLYPPKLAPLPHSLKCHTHEHILVVSTVQQHPIATHLSTCPFIYKLVYAMLSGQLTVILQEGVAILNLFFLLMISPSIEICFLKPILDRGKPSL